MTQSSFPLFFKDAYFNDAMCTCFYSEIVSSMGLGSLVRHFLPMWYKGYQHMIKPRITDQGFGVIDYKKNYVISCIFLKRKNQRPYFMAQSSRS